MDNKKEETVQIGDTIYKIDEITPSVYFDYVKGLKKKVSGNELNLIVDTALKMLEKTKITGQTSAAKEITHLIELALKEVAAAKDGFDIFVARKDIDKYIHNVEGKAIKIIELARYDREIPDEVIPKLITAKKHFDEIYIFFTDYTKKETKKVAKERRDKDPIMFGAFHDTDARSNKVCIEDKLFFIADWVDEKCDLTLEEIATDIKSREGRDITYRVEIPEDEAAVKKLIKTYDQEGEVDEVYEPVSIFTKIKNKISRKKTSEDSTEEPKKKSTRGRKKKTILEE